MTDPAGLGEAFSKAILQLQQLQQAFAANHVESTNNMSKVGIQEAMTSQLALITSLSTSLQQTFASDPTAGSGATSNENADVNVATHPIGNMEGMMKQAHEHVLSAGNDVSLKRGDTTPVVAATGMLEQQKETVERDVEKSGCENAGNEEGYTFPMFFGSPKEQRTPDARPAPHASHHTIHVAARQQRSNSQVARGTNGFEKKLTFLLPETPVDASKHNVGYPAGDRIAASKMADEALDTLAGAVNMTNMTSTITGNVSDAAYAANATTPGGAKTTGGMPHNTPGKVASTPMAIEVLSQLFNHSQQMSQQSQALELYAAAASGADEDHKELDTTAADKLDAQDEDYAFDELTASLPLRGGKGMKTKPKRRHSKPRSTVKEKAARAASLAVARPKKSAATMGKTCNCKKSQCLKMYCDCFAASGYCHPSCTCESCKNTNENEDVVNMARAGILLKDPTAFDEKVDGKAGTHRKGCRCKRSKCLKKYCECYQAGVPCNETCQCVGCANCEGDATKLEYPTAPTTRMVSSTKSPQIDPLPHAAIPGPTLPSSGDPSPQQVPVPCQMVAVPMKMPDGSTQMVAVPMQFNESTMQAFRVPSDGSQPVVGAVSVPDLAGGNNAGYTQRSTQDSTTSLKVLKEKNGNGNAAPQQFPSQQEDNSAHPSHLESQTPLTDAEAPSPAAQPLVGSKSRRITSIAAGVVNMPDWRQFSSVKTPSSTKSTEQMDTEKENKRPRRAASSGVAAAAAAAKHGVSHDRVGFEQKWDTITPPCRVRRRKKASADPLALIENGESSKKDIFAPFTDQANINAHFKNYPKKAEARLLLLKALEKEKEVKTKEEEADAATVLFSLAQ